MSDVRGGGLECAPIGTELETMRDEERPMSHVITRTIARLVPTLLLIVLSTAGIASGQEWPADRPGFGHPPRGRGGAPKPPPMDRLLEEHAERLDLDSETQEQIRLITTTSRVEGDQMRDRLHALHREMRELLSQDSPDEAQVMEQVEQIGLLEIEARQHRLRGMLRVRALLTPDQRQELVRIHDEQKRSRGDRRDRDDYAGPPRGSPPGGHRPQF